LLELALSPPELIENPPFLSFLSKLYPGAKTHIPATATATVDPKREELGLKLEKKDVKKKRPFSASEDLALKEGFDQVSARLFFVHSLEGRKAKAAEGNQYLSRLASVDGRLRTLVWAGSS